MWNATHLENLARTYWLFLSRVTGWLIRVVYDENGRSVVFLGPAADAAPVRRPRVRDRARPRQGQLAHPRRAAGRARRPGLRLPVARRQTPRRRARRAGQGPDRGRGRELLPRDRGRLQHARVRGDPVRDPRARDARVPALPGQARARAVEGRPLRATRRTCARPDGRPDAWRTRPHATSATAPLTDLGPRCGIRRGSSRASNRTEPDSVNGIRLRRLASSRTCRSRIPRARHPWGRSAKGIRPDAPRSANGPEPNSPRPCPAGGDATTSARQGCRRDRPHGRRRRRPQITRSGCR